MALISIRAKWRSTLSAYRSVEKKYLTQPALLERRFHDTYPRTHRLSRTASRKPRHTPLQSQDVVFVRRSASASVVRDRFCDDPRSRLVHVLFVHVLQRRPWNALQYRSVASDKLKVGSFRFLINVHHGQYPVVALSGNAVVLPWNAECHVPSLRRPYRHSRGGNFKLHHYRIVGVTSPCRT